MARLARALARAADLEDVVAAIVTDGLALTGAVAGILAVVTERGDELRVLADFGFLPGDLDPWREVPLSAPTVVGEAARTGELVLVRTAAERRARFPNHALVHPLSQGGAGVGVPLLAAGATVGALSLTYPDERALDDAERAALRAMGDLCAHALARALLLERERAARAESERLREEFAATFDQAPIGVAHTDHDHRWLRFNRKMCEITGYPPDELFTLDWRAITHPDDLPAQLELERQMLDGAIPSFRIEKRYRRKDGSVVWVELRTAAIRQEGQPVYSIAMVEDISERRRADAHRQFQVDLDDRLRMLDGVAAITAEAAGSIARHLAVDACYFVEIDLDRRVATIMAGEAPGGPALTGAFPLDAFLAPAAFEAVRAGEVVAVADVTDDPAVPPDGAGAALAIDTAAWCLVPWIQGGVWRAGVTVHARRPRTWAPDELAVLRDVTARVWPLVERARVADELRRNEERYRAIVRATSSVVWQIDPDGRIDDAFAAWWRELTGQSRAELDGWGWLDALHPDDRERVRTEQSEAMARRVPFESAYRLRTATGQERHLHVRAVPLLDPDGAVREWFGTVADVTELKTLERAQQDFTAAASHDLKNPISAVKAETQLMLRRLARGDIDPTRLARGLASVARQTDAMSALVDDLVDVAVLRAGRPVELSRAPVDLGGLVERTAALHRTRYGGEISVDLPDMPLVARVDERRVERVVDNLLGNAVKFSPNLSPIRVELGRTALDGLPAARIAVHDRGVGIPAADLPIVFERFRRGGNVGGVAGTGIGLSGARQIVELHGGRITVDSVEGAGSTFAVTLPLHPPVNP